ncbi:MAG: LysM peptidoglycan-binding domain-containing protein [Chitinophagaceae bacterium]|nr:MAG: LysM peptidoglycan-binding domain-containing protein [Chitinophagaceae bacterium]
MRKWILAIGMLCTIGNTYAQKATYTDMVNRYITQYRDMAIAEQRRSGVPAAVTLAQGIHETVAGSSRLATMANNHFGIKCKKEWTGETFKHTDDAPDECFRKYTSAANSYQDHSDYLVKSPRYAGLFKLDITDYEGWAFGLKKAGYATNPQYAQALIKIIEDYKLQDHTFAALSDAPAGTNTIASAKPGEVVPEHDAPVVPAAVVTTTPATTPVVTNANITTTETTTPEVQVTRTVAHNPNSKLKVDEGTSTYPPYGQLTRANGIKAVYAKKGDTPLEYAFKFDIRYERLLEINDIGDKPLPFDMYLYLERKNFTGSKPTHTVAQGETLLQVAQEEGMQLKFLRAMNLLEPGEEPMPGAVLELQHRAKQKPEIIASTAAKSQELPKAIETRVAATPAQVAVEKTTPATNTANTATILEQAGATKEVLTPASAETTTPVVAKIPVATDKTTTEVAATPAATPVEAVVTKDPVSTPVATPPVTVPPVTTTTNSTTPGSKVSTSEIVDELDALKAKFDQAIYTKKTEEKTTATTPVAETPKATPPSGDAKFYVVKKGDTAFSIAKRNNITMTQLRDWNNLAFGEIKIGQKLRIQ